jgi:hypothetical protein
MQTRATGALVALAIGFFLGSAGQAGADITWGAPTGISGDSDVDTAGTYVGAAYLTSPQLGGPAFTIVNGVTFVEIALSGQDGGFGHFVFSTPGDFTSPNHNTGFQAPPFSNLSAPYQMLLSFTAAPAENLGSPSPDYTLAMHGLISGHSYAFEWWANDSNIANGPLWTAPVVATDGSSVTLNPNPLLAPGGLGQFAIGTFTANSTAIETITFSSPSFAVGGLVNAFELRDLGPAGPVVPEPATLTMFGMGVAGLGIARWRKRKQAG